MLEKEMYPLIKTKFAQNYDVFFEVPLLNSRKKIDVLCIRKKTKYKELIAIEAKIKDRRKVISQAMTRLSIADKVYIALYEDFINENTLNCFSVKNYNIGVISVNGNAKIIKKAKKSPFLIQSRRKRIINNVLKNTKIER